MGAGSSNATAKPLRVAGFAPIHMSEEMTLDPTLVNSTITVNTDPSNYHITLSIPKPPVVTTHVIIEREENEENLVDHSTNKLSLFKLHEILVACNELLHNPIQNLKPYLSFDYMRFMARKSAKLALESCQTFKELAIFIEKIQVLPHLAIIFPPPQYHCFESKLSEALQEIFKKLKHHPGVLQISEQLEKFLPRKQKFKSMFAPQFGDHLYKTLSMFYKKRIACF